MYHKSKDEVLVLGDLDRRVRDAVAFTGRLYSALPPDERMSRVYKQIDRIVARALEDLDEDLSELEGLENKRH